MTLGGVVVRLRRVGARVLNYGDIFAPSIRERQLPGAAPGPLTNPTKDRAGQDEYNIMAILSGINTRMSGKVGDWKYSQRDGMTVVSQMAAKKSVSKGSYAQMSRRVQWANLVNLYQAFAGYLHPSFENRERCVSDYQMFVGVNVGNPEVYLTKEEARQGGCVVAGYQVTCGSLPSIAAELGEGGICKTSVQLGDMVIGNDTTVKEFSTAVLANNEDFLNGDKITVFVAHQILDAVTSIPRVVIKATDLVLDREDEVTLLRDTAQAVGFSSVDGCLASSGMVDGAIVWIHSRREAGMTKVSSQRFVVSNGILAQYQTQTKKEEAILSYGGTIKELYLTPTSNDVEVAHVNP